MGRKILGLLLSICMSAALLTGCGSTGSTETGGNTAGAAGTENTGAQEAEDTDPYAEHLSFEVFTIDGSEDMMDLPLVKEACEKFNIDFSIQIVAWDNWDDVTNTLAATDSFPEVIAWYNLNYAQYVEWAQEGVLKALPEDMSAYPNLEALMEKYTIFEKLKVDGNLYAFPKIKNNNPYNEYDSYMFAYRRDWAEAMGLDYAPVQDLTWDEFIDYLELLKEKDPGNLGDKLIPFDLEHGGNSWAGFARMWNPYISSYEMVDGQYQWGALDESSLEGIYEIKEMYDKGLLASDSYTDANNAGKERFLAGRSGVFYGNLGPAVLQTTVETMMENIDGFEEDDLGLFTIKMDDGKYHVRQMDEWWAAFAFDHKCSDEVMERWLAVGDWLLEQEQIEKYAYGVPEEDWTKDADGNVTLNYSNEDKAAGGSKEYISLQQSFQKFFILEGLDLFLDGNPSRREYIIEDLFRENMERWATNPFYTPNNYDINYFSAQEKDSFASVLSGTGDIVIQAVISNEPEKIWNQFISDNAAQAELACEEINERFGE